MKIKNLNLRQFLSIYVHWICIVVTFVMISFTYFTFNNFYQNGMNFLVGNLRHSANTNGGMLLSVETDHAIDQPVDCQSAAKKHELTDPDHIRVFYFIKNYASDALILNTPVTKIYGSTPQSAMDTFTEDSKLAPFHDFGDNPVLIVACIYTPLEPHQYLFFLQGYSRYTSIPPKPVDMAFDVGRYLQDGYNQHFHILVATIFIGFLTMTTITSYYWFKKHPYEKNYYSWELVETQTSGIISFGLLYGAIYFCIPIISYGYILDKNIANIIATVITLIPMTIWFHQQNKYKNK